MKRIAKYALSAIAIIVVVCSFALPAFADTVPSSMYDYWENDGYSPDFTYSSYRVRFLQVEPNFVTDWGLNSMYIYGDCYFYIWTEYGSFAFYTNELSIFADYDSITPSYQIYSGESLMFKWTADDPDMFYLYSGGMSQYPYEEFTEGDIIYIDLFFDPVRIGSVTGSVKAIFDFFGDYATEDQGDYMNGFTNGIQIGYDQGYQAGYDEGYGVGGYQDGYDAGYSQAEDDLLDSKVWGANFLGNTFNAVWDGLMQFNLVQTPNGTVITLGAIVGACIGVALFVMFLKWFAGG